MVIGGALDDKITAYRGRTPKSVTIGLRAVLPSRLTIFRGRAGPKPLAAKTPPPTSSPSTQHIGEATTPQLSPCLPELRRPASSTLMSPSEHDFMTPELLENECHAVVAPVEARMLQRFQLEDGRLTNCSRITAAATFPMERVV